MADARTRRRFGSIALALLASLILLGIATPIIVSIGSFQISLSSSQLVAAPRDSLVITTPLPLGIGGLVTVEGGLLYPSDSRGRALDAPLNEAQIAGGGSRFVIENATLRLRATPAVPAPEHSSRLMDAVGALQFETVILRKASLHVVLPDGREEILTDITAEITHRRKASLQFKGKGYLRGQRIKFDATAGLAAESRSAAPFKLTMRNGAMQLSFDGRAILAPAMQLNGAIDLKVTDLRQMASWFKATWPAGEGLRDFRGRGQLDWAGATIVVNKAAVEMDGSEAGGTLHLSLSGERPSFGGTLALKSMDLGRYFPRRLDVAKVISAAGWSRLMTTDLSMPLAREIDADLRISSDKVTVGGMQFGRVAAAVTVAHGKLLADVGAFEFDGGRGSGQFSVDMAGPSPKITIRGRLDDIDASRMTANLFGHPAVTGKATMSCDLASSGRTGDDLLAASQGKLNFEVRSGGRFGVDLSALAAASAPRATEGWGNSARGTTTFETLDARFAVRSGVLFAEQVRSVSGDINTAFAGRIDVPASRIYANVIQVPAMPAQKQGGEQAAGLSLQIFGPWAAPTVRNDSGRESAADPNLGGGMSPAHL